MSQAMAFSGVKIQYSRPKNLSRCVSAASDHELICIADVSLKENMTELGLIKVITQFGVQYG